jgi:DNA-directed RNA polymerase subunit beta
MLRTETVRNFSKVGDALPVPNLNDLQITSYARFLQTGVEPDKRKNQGLEALLRETFPIVSYDGATTLEYLDYALDDPRYTPQECRDLRLTYGRPFRVRLRLSSSHIKGVVEENVYIGEMPIMIGGGEFIINGAERVIVSQLHRSPGVDFTVEMQESDRPLHGARIIPERGSWIELSVNTRSWGPPKVSFGSSTRPKRFPSTISSRRPIWSRHSSIRTPARNSFPPAVRWAKTSPRSSPRRSRSWKWSSVSAIR